MWLKLWYKYSTIVEKSEQLKVQQIGRSDGRGTTNQRQPTNSTKQENIARERL